MLKIVTTSAVVRLILVCVSSIVVGQATKGIGLAAGKWVTKDGQFVEFFPDNTCARTDSGAKGWITIKGKIRIDKIGDIFCDSDQGGSGFYVRKGSNTLTLDYGMGGAPELFVRAAVAQPSSIERFAIHTAKGDVSVLDFRKHPALVTQDQSTIVLADTNDFHIEFYVPDSSFLILTLVKPFPIARKRAEVAFLKDVGLSQAEACKLSVREGTTIHIDPKYAGQNFTLSFCSAQ